MRDLKSGSARRAMLALGAGLIASAAASAAGAETIGGALIKAYLSNPSINASRANVRAYDERVPQANAGYLPQVSANLNAGVTSIQGLPAAFGGGANGDQTSLPRGYGVTVTQNVWNGNKTFNTVRQAESNVFGQRELLRKQEQDTLLAALTAYMDVMRDTATLDLNRSNVELLKEQLRQTRDRFNVGEVTRTDVAQAESALAQGQATYDTSIATLQKSISTYRQQVGDQPAKLAPVSPLGRLLPTSLPTAIAISQVENPNITAYIHGVDIALLSVKIAEAALYPTVNLQASLTKSFDASTLGPGSRELVGVLGGQINIPIYDGGASFGAIRQAKEQVSQQELTLDVQRDAVRQSVVAAWFANVESPGVVKAAKAQVAAEEVALAGVREEAKVGQRTTLDVLNEVQRLLQARVALVDAQHDQVVNSYTLLDAIGRLSIKNLGLNVAEYDPRTHYDLVKTKQFGVRTPDGR
jgi:outer membrane protein